LSHCCFIQSSLKEIVKQQLPTWDWDDVRIVETQKDEVTSQLTNVHHHKIISALQSKVKRQLCICLYCKQLEIRHIRYDERCRNIMNLLTSIEWGSACRLNLNWTYMRKWRLKRCRFEWRRVPEECHDSWLCRHYNHWIGQSVNVTGS
jgi:hypothetical protein